MFLLASEVLGCSLLGSSRNPFLVLFVPSSPPSVSVAKAVSRVPEKLGVNVKYLLSKAGGYIAEELTPCSFSLNATYFFQQQLRGLVFAVAIRVFATVSYYVAVVDTELTVFNLYQPPSCRG